MSLLPERKFMRVGKKIWFSTLLMGCLGLMLASSAAALELVYPEDGVYITKSNYLIIKAGTSPVITGMIIDINGVESDVVDISSAEYKQAFGDLLILEPSFDPGENTVKVYGLSGRKRVSEVEAKLFFADKPSTPIPDEYRPFVMHTSAKEGACTTCHNMQPTEQELMRTGARNPCASCHKRMLGKEHVHGPAGVFQCVYCHDAEEKGSKYRVPSIDSACVECHDDMVLRSSPKNYVHGPIEAGLCVVCHDPHASDNPAQLVEPVNELCTGCHEIDYSVHAVRGIRRQGHPLKGDYDPLHLKRPFTCISCHNPHEGKSPYYLQYGITERLNLCQKCHQK
jgi:predicted CXXCH cytochrome family protein